MNEGSDEGVSIEVTTETSGGSATTVNDLESDDSSEVAVAAIDDTADGLNAATVVIIVIACLVSVTGSLVAVAVLRRGLRSSGSSLRSYHDRSSTLRRSLSSSAVVPGDATLIRVTTHGVGVERYAFLD